MPLPTADHARTLDADDRGVRTVVGSGTSWQSALERAVEQHQRRRLLEQHRCRRLSTSKMTSLRPQRVGMLLRHCRSIKAKRLFLALAERHAHAWLAHVPMEGVDLGTGKRSLVPGGRLDPTYQITLPGDLDEHLG